MKIKNVKVKNFKCLGGEELKIDFSEDIVVLIGENNVGKSSILQALKYFFSGKTIPKELFYNGITDEDNAIEITIEFNNLSDKDKNHRAVNPYVQNNDGEDIWTLKKKYYYKDDGEADRSYSAKKPDGKWKKHPAGLRQVVDDLFTKEKMQIAFVEAVKEVTEESSASTKAAFGQIFNMLVRNDVEKSGQYKDLEKAIAEYIKLFEGKNKLLSINTLENDLNSKIQRVISAISKIKLEIPSFKDKIMPTPILLTNDQRKIDVSPQNQGNGFQRTLIFCLLEILAEQTSPSSKVVGPKNLIMIEEPEIYMHPQMERKIADTLYEIAKDGSAQIICTTHSPIFINIADKHRALIRITRNQYDDLILTQVDEIFMDPDKENKKKRLRMMLNFDPTVNEIFFAKRVVLVEGDTEITVFKEGAELLGIFRPENLPHLKRDVTFVNCRGKWTIAAFQEVLNRFKIEYVVIHDKDEDDAEIGANAKILSLLKGDETRRKMFDKKIEDQLGISETGKDKPFKALEKVKELSNSSKLDSKMGAYIKFAYGVNN